MHGLVNQDSMHAGSLRSLLCAAILVVLHGGSMLLPGLVLLLIPSDHRAVQEAGRGAGRQPPCGAGHPGC